jgi:hypothetical protein
MAKKNEEEGLVRVDDMLPSLSSYGDFVPASEELDNEKIIPQLKVLQGLSPQAQEGGADYIPGAKPGVLLNTGTGEVHGAKDGVYFVPVTRQHVFVEWVPRKDGGGLVAVHQPDSDVVRWAKENSEFGKWQTPAKNDLKETFYVFGILLSDPNDLGSASEPVVFAISGSKIKPYRQAFDKIRSMKLRTPKGVVRPPMFAHRLHITTFLDKNKNNEPFHNLRFSFAIDGDRKSSLIAPEGEGLAFLRAAADLAQDITGGQRRADLGEDDQTEVADEASSAF